MRSLLSLVAILAALAASGSAASACERHLHGHQTSSDTTGEAMRR